jgi:hypothetical protein
MNRNDYDTIEASAHVAMAGLLAGEGAHALDPQHLSRLAFDVAEAFSIELKSRIGERPNYSE